MDQLKWPTVYIFLVAQREFVMEHYKYYRSNNDNV